MLFKEGINIYKLYGLFPNLTKYLFAMFFFLGNPESMFSDLLVPASKNIVNSELYLEPVDFYKSNEDEHKFLW